MARDLRLWPWSTQWLCWTRIFLDGWWYIHLWELCRTAQITLYSRDVRCRKCCILGRSLYRTDDGNDLLQRLEGLHRPLRRWRDRLVVSRGAAHSFDALDEQAACLFALARCEEQANPYANE